MRRTTLSFFCSTKQLSFFRIRLPNKISILEAVELVRDSVHTMCDVSAPSETQRLTRQSYCDCRSYTFFLYERLRVKVIWFSWHQCNSCIFLNSLPLSVSIPLIAKGKFCLTSWTPFFTQRWALFKSARFSVHPEWTSVSVRVHMYCPSVLMPQWAAVSASKKPRLAKLVYARPNQRPRSGAARYSAQCFARYVLIRWLQSDSIPRRWTSG